MKTIVNAAQGCKNSVCRTFKNRSRARFRKDLGVIVQGEGLREEGGGREPLSSRRTESGVIGPGGGWLVIFF